MPSQPEFLQHARDRLADNPPPVGWEESTRDVPLCIMLWPFVRRSTFEALERRCELLHEERNLALATSKDLAGQLLEARQQLRRFVPEDVPPSA